VVSIDLPDWLPTWSDVTGWWASLTTDPQRLAVLVLVVLVVLVLLRWLLRSWLGRVFLIVAAVVIYMAASGRSIG
jgi:MFS superfamily sulfate permease-like transporter